jgi:pimeloyl-ACP methyl ester carboxylesterase
VPNLPAGFIDTFTSRYTDTGDLRLHAVIGGAGPPLLLVHGWPQTWYAWRFVMPALAEAFEVIAVDQRGIGLSAKPKDGYDAGTLAGDLIATMDAPGKTMELVTDNAQAVVIPGAGHWVAEQAPEELLAALTEFLAPYRDGAGVAVAGSIGGAG